ncbi:MAG: hypothetical protein ACON47_06670 [Flavobacteriaceae bacterium]
MKRLIDNSSIKVYGTHLALLAALAIIALGFYAPLLSGKVLLQSDIQQYKSMGRQIQESRSNHDGEETYWIDNAFVGMPTFQLGAQYPADFLQPLYYMTRFLPRPANLLFLYLLAAYVLFSVLKIRKELAFLGALAFGFSTYLLIILQVGHNTKAEAIGYFPLVLAGFVLLIQNKRLWGGVLSVLALGMQIRANHYQMTYYLLWLLFAMGLVYGVAAYRKKKLVPFFTQMAIFVGASILALGLNATPLLATSEYTQFSTRGPSELKLNVDGTPKESTGGLDYEYITQYSYGIFESFSLLFPRIQGGGSREDLGMDSDLYRYLIQGGISPSQASSFVAAVPTYWGDQPILEAPAYVGIILVFLSVLGVLSTKGPFRNSLLLGIIISLLLSWGKNIPWLTHFLIDVVPFYSKFRAVSSAQVILELCVPILAVWGLDHFWKSTPDLQKKRLLQAVLLFFGMILILWLCQGMLSFQGTYDGYFKQSYGEALFSEIVAARKQIYTDDLVRGALLVAVTGGVLYGIVLRKLSQKLGIVAIMLLVCFDLLQISSRYINRDLFVSPRIMNQTFIPSKADRTILADSSRFRVYDSETQLNSAQSAYFHRSIGGYHGAKPRRLQEIFDFFIENRTEAILNMLNVKYVLYSEAGSKQVLRNPEAFGIAWPVDSLLLASDADTALQFLKSIDLRTQAVVTQSDWPDKYPMPKEIDSSFHIALRSEAPNKLKYAYTAKKDQFVVFSESYYKNGWQAKAGDQVLPIVKVNHLLRGLWLPADANHVLFEFRPPVIALGTSIRWASLFVFLGSILGGWWISKRKTTA